MEPQGLRELKVLSPVLFSVRARDEKSARARDGLDLKSFRDSVKFSNPALLAAMSGADMSNVADAASVSFVPIFLCFLSVL